MKMNKKETCKDSGEVLAALRAVDRDFGGKIRRNERSLGIWYF